MKEKTRTAGERACRRHAGHVSRVNARSPWRSALGRVLAAAAATAMTVAADIPSGAPAGAPSPAERRIAWAQGAVEKNPRSARFHSNLAMAFAARARETSDPVFYDRAAESIRRALEIEPESFEARKAEAWTLLGKHEFAAAREKARALNRRAPDDLQVYAFLVDANVELGNYREAEEAAQWLLDIRPGNPLGLTRAAYLRELFGDLGGAEELMSGAYHQALPTEVEDRAWLLTQIAHLKLAAGNTASAETLVQKALGLFPGYHYSLALLADVRAAQGRHEEAAELRRRHVQAAPHPENFFYYARALERAGRRDEAAAAFQEFEARARAEMEGNDNANRELAFYYADHAGRPAEAVAIARREAERRRDVYTLDALAWALYRNGDLPQARTEMAKVLAVGTRAPEILSHASAISNGGQI